MMLPGVVTRNIVNTLEAYSGALCVPFSLAFDSTLMLHGDAVFFFARCVASATSLSVTMQHSTVHAKQCCRMTPIPKNREWVFTVILAGIKAFRGSRCLSCTCADGAIFLGHGNTVEQLSISRSLHHGYHFVCSSQKSVPLQRVFFSSVS